MYMYKIQLYRSTMTINAGSIQGREERNLNRNHWRYIGNAVFNVNHCHGILRTCKTDMRPAAFCALYARFSVSFLCQSAEITMADTTHCVIQIE